MYSIILYTPFIWHECNSFCNNKKKIKFKFHIVLVWSTAFENCEQFRLYKPNKNGVNREILCMILKEFHPHFVTDKRQGI